jgi:enamine deaminase RidA (YjgF/YER057c/UK114 family)
VTRIVVALLIIVAGVAGCGGGADPAQDKALCAAVARDMAGVGLDGTPTQAQAKQAGDRLDARVTEVASPAVHEAVVALHSHVHQVEAAQARKNAAAAERSAGRARQDARKLAKVCGLPETRLLGASAP